MEKSDPQPPASAGRRDRTQGAGDHSPRTQPIPDAVTAFMGHTYEHPHDAYAVGQGRSKTSLESGLAWANAIESPETRDYAIKGVVHGLLEEGSHFTSERISLMSPDDPMRRKAVLAMVEWLEINGMTQEAAPWRDQLSDGN